MLLKLSFVVGGIASFALLDASATDLVVNGSFENPALSGSDLANGYKPFSAGDFLTGTDGWVVSQQSIDIVRDTGTYHWTAQDGHQSVDLNGTAGIGAIKQTITVPKEGNYTLSFWYAGNFLGGDLNDKSFTFKLGPGSGSETGKLGSGTPENPTWTQVVGTYHLKGSVDLEFISTYTGNAFEGAAVDNVSLVAVPEPYQCGVVSLLGLFGLAAADRLRQRKLNRKL